MTRPASGADAPDGVSSRADGAVAAFNAVVGALRELDADTAARVLAAAAILLELKEVSRDRR